MSLLHILRMGRLLHISWAYILVWIRVLPRVRYPLLWNCPAESQNELLELMDAIQHVHGIHQEDQTKLLLESCREQRMHNMRYPSAASVSVDSTTLQHLLRHPSDSESILDNSQSGLLPIAVRSGMSRMISSFKNSLKLQ